MQLGRVIGTLVPAVAYEGLAGVPMLWVQPLDKRQAPKGRAMVCADGTRMAGPGELVYWEASREAALTLDPWFVPVDHAIVGIVDGVQIDDEELDDADRSSARTSGAGPGAGGPRTGREPAMILARVVGRLYSTIHHPGMANRKILILDRLKPDRTPTGSIIIALDGIGAGAGETVLVLDEGTGARQILGDPNAPVRSLVVGIVDDVMLGGS